MLPGNDWPGGGAHENYLGFAIQRNPGYARGGKADYLFNKLDLKALADGAKPKPSNNAPIENFNWWDGGLKPSDRGKIVNYTITPVLGSGPDDLSVESNSGNSIAVTIPRARPIWDRLHPRRGFTASRHKRRRGADSLQRHSDGEAPSLVRGDKNAYRAGTLHISSHSIYLSAGDTRERNSDLNRRALEPSNLGRTR